MAVLRSGWIVLAGMGLLAAGAPAAGEGGSLHRPLHLRHVPHGAPCPPSKGHVKLFGPGTPMGITDAGPAHFMSVGGEPPASVGISWTPLDPKHYKGQKAPWIIGRTYRGPVLIRGTRLDAPGPVRFSQGGDQRLTALYLRRGERVQPSGRRVLGSLLLVRTPGCYGLQVDGLTFSQTIVVRVHG
jgi:hypothetical protein